MKILMQVAKGKLVPADGLAEQQLREKGFQLGDQVNVQISKARNHGYHRLAHAFGQLVVENIDGFEELDGHSVIKRLQLETGLECDEMRIQTPEGAMLARVPRSLSFGAMEQVRFENLMQGLARHVATVYWRDEVDADEVIEMAAQILGTAA